MSPRKQARSRTSSPSAWVPKPDKTNVVKILMDHVEMTQSGGHWLITTALVRGIPRVVIDRRPVPATRLAYRCFEGEIPSGGYVVRTCDEPACVAPPHLAVTTPQGAGKLRRDPVRTDDREDRAWMAFAACQGHDTELFFQESTGRTGAYDQARKICGTCFVREDCLEFALRHHEKWGLWGGLTPNERAEVKRRRRTMRAG